MTSYGDRTWDLAQDAAEPIVRRAVEAGMTFFDIADMYSDGVSEEITGSLLADYSRAETTLPWQRSPTFRLDRP